MDVICIRDEIGYYHCSDFYIKFRLQNQTTNLILGTSTIDKKTPLQEKFLESFPTATNGELLELIKQDIKNIQQSITNEPDLIEITVNNHKIDNIISFIGDNLLLHFYDPLLHQYFLTPNQTILQSFQLQTGKNIVKCYHRGTQTTRFFNIYLVHKDTSFVVMDIDGTITKSDLTGYIQTVYMGMFSYIHDGVIEFLNYLVNKYHYYVLYLTARPMAHRQMTQQLLQQCRSEDGFALPDGPLITSRDRISMALYREVILKDTVTTKSDTLLNIVDVFKRAGNMNFTPFVLGVGNKENDAIAYNSSGISTDRILLIDNSSKIQVWRYATLASTPTIPQPSSSSNSVNPSTKEHRSNTPSKKLHTPFPLSRSNSGKQSPYTVPPPPVPTPATSAATSRATSKDQPDLIGSITSFLDFNKKPASATGSPAIKRNGRYIKSTSSTPHELTEAEEDDDDVFHESNGYLLKPSAINENALIYHRRCPNCDEEECQCSSVISLPMVYTFQTYKDKQLYRYIDYLATVPPN
eukprot:gene4219-4519_t